MKILKLLFLLAISFLILISSSGTFREYDSKRNFQIDIVTGNSSYISYYCEYQNSSNIVTIEANSSGVFDVLSVENKLGENLNLRIEGDYSSLPPSLDVDIESEWILLYDQDTYTFTGVISAGDVTGNYEVPLTLYGTWNTGDAEVSTCPLRINVIEPLITITKDLISGPTVFPVNTNQTWMMRITVVNNGGDKNNLIVKDTIPAELEVNLAQTSVSIGNYTAVKMGNCHGIGATKVTWTFDLPAGTSAHMNITVTTREKCHCGHQSCCHIGYTSPGIYNLNDGANLTNYEIVTDPITVIVTDN